MCPAALLCFVVSCRVTVAIVIAVLRVSDMGFGTAIDVDMA